MIGLPAMAATVVLPSWWTPRVLITLAAVVVGGAVAYHLLTSVVPCPSCGKRLFNLGIGAVDAQRKLFTCSRCGAKAWLKEGFYWQSDING